MSHRQEPAVYAAFDGMIRARSLPRRSFSRMILVSASLFLAGCGGEPRLALPADPSPTPGTPLQTVPVVSTTPVGAIPALGEVVWTTETDSVTGEPADVITRYLTEAPHLVAATRATALPAGSRIEATWAYNDTPLDAFTTRLSPRDGSDGAWLSFYLSRDPNTPWPAGLYEITVTRDGTLVLESAVEVVDAA